MDYLWGMNEKDYREWRLRGLAREIMVDQGLPWQIWTNVWVGGSYPKVKKGWVESDDITMSNTRKETVENRIC